MDLGSITISGERDGTGAIATFVSPKPTNLAFQNIASFDAKQQAELAKLRRAMTDAAVAYFEYVNRPHEVVTDESEDHQVGVNKMAVDGDAPKVTKKPAKKEPA